MNDTSIRDPTDNDGTSADGITAEQISELLQNQQEIITNQKTLLGYEKNLLDKTDILTEAVIWIFLVLLFALGFKILFGTFSSIFNNA